MKLFIPLCVLCACACPLLARSLDAHATDPEPFVAHHHHEGNIAELLIPLLERTLAQRGSSEHAHTHRKPAKKVIQVLPYRGSAEHERKGWHKLNHRKKQVVEITPLHGKNRAKPLAYILSAAKPSRAEHAARVSDASFSEELGHDKYSSEEPLSSEEEQLVSDLKDVKLLRTGNVESSERGGKTSEVTAESQAEADDVTDNVTDEEAVTQERSDAVTQENVTAEDGVTQERKDDVTSETVTSEDNVTKERDAVTSEFVTAEDNVTEERNGAVTEENVSAEEEIADNAEVSKEAWTVEDNVTGERNGAVTKENWSAEDNVTGEKSDGVTKENITKERNGAVTVEDVTAEDVSQERAGGVTKEAVTVEDVSIENITGEEKDAVAQENVTTEERAAVTNENVTGEDKDAASKENVTEERGGAVTKENLSEEESITNERLAVTSEAISNEERNGEYNENVTVEKSAGQKHHENALSELLGGSVLSSPEQAQGFIENDIVISRGQQGEDSAEKTFSKLFNSRARDIIELIQSSAEGAPHRDCPERNRNNHDHKSYRLSFLFNK